MTQITSEIQDFVHGFTKRCNELGVHDDAMISHLLKQSAVATGTAAAKKSDEDYYRGAGKPINNAGEAKNRQVTGGEVNGVSQFTNMGTSENYQRG